MAGILPLLIALITAHAAALQPADLHEGNNWIVLASLGLFSAIHVLLSMVVGRVARHALIRFWDMAGLGLLLGLNAWWCLSLGWTEFSEWSVVILAPMMTGLCLHWYSLGVASGSGWGAGSLWALWLRLRIVFLPVLLLIAVMDVFQWAVSMEQLQPYWETTIGIWVLLLASLSAPILALTFLPPFLVQLWGARPLKEGRQADDLNAWCKDSGVSIRAIMVWPAKGVPFYNACVLGLWSRFRYILISEDLLRDCPPEEVKAVLGHELGHAHHGHLWFYLLFLLASGLWAQLATDFVVEWSYSLFPLLASPIGVALVTIIIWAFALRIGFGILSRASERQADLYGARMAGDPCHMSSALYSVAHYSGTNPHEPNWRHYSIADRVAFLGRLREVPKLQSLHHRYMKNLRAIILILLGVGLALTLFAPQRYIELDALRQQDAQLDQALTQAQDGNRDALQRWLVQESPAARRGLAGAILHRLSDETIRADDRLLYDHRHWLIPFAHVSTGDDWFDTNMDNCLAYGLSAGTYDHSAEDLSLMKSLVEPLAKAAEDLEDAAIWDTVGCLHFALDNRPEAVNAFQRAQQILATIDDSDTAMMALRRIVNERSKAAMDPEAKLPTVWGLEGQLNSEGKAIEWVNPENIEQAIDGSTGEVIEDTPLDASLRQ